MVLPYKHGSGHKSTAQTPSPHHHHHHYHARAPAPTNGGTGLKAAEGFICGTVTVASCRGNDASQTGPPHRFPKIAYKCLKIRQRLCRDQDASRTWLAHCAHKLPRNA
ncbi:Hypothetical predicted protein [Olea europaea subsp. europaea]|uniref:Uncharacterized protein n=1 Tax=Olea europaea subsp. europaea TaxID=158383 RepID=A0A8S0PL95_OLEEU|nr:Hypothetical predicted protein [Olea europaea subsp. europaea]